MNWDFREVWKNKTQRAPRRRLIHRGGDGKVSAVGFGVLPGVVWPIVDVVKRFQPLDMLYHTASFIHRVGGEKVSAVG